MFRLGSKEFSDIVVVLCFELFGKASGFRIGFRVWHGDVAAEQFADVMDGGEFKDFADIEMCTCCIDRRSQLPCYHCDHVMMFCEIAESCIPSPNGIAVLRLISSDLQEMK